MNNGKKTTIFLILFIVTATAVQSLDIGAKFHIGNMAFRRDRESTATDFTGLYFPWGIDAYLNHDITDEFGLHIGYYMDPILRKSLYTRFTYRYKFLTLGVGPFFGILNSQSSILKSGITTNVRLEAPGILFVDFRADSSIGGHISQTGDYIQERSDISVGFYIPNAICSFNVLTKKYTEKTDTGEAIDDLTEYSFAVDIFQKNSPYKVLLTFGYQDLSKIFIETGTTITHTLGTIFGDARVDIFLTDFLTLMTQFRGGIYTFGLNELIGLSNPGPGGFLFNASAGFSLDIDTIAEKTTKTEQP